MARGFFITGTDTDVGKSYFGAQFVRYLHTQGKSVQPRKPIESGCINNNGVLIPGDGLAYYQAIDKQVSLNIITPYRYEPAIAAPQAMSDHNRVNLQQVADAIYHDYKQSDILIVEGAGGFYSPLCMDASNADLAIKLQLPLIVVVANKVGCINHCLLTIEAIINKQLSIAAIVINDIHQDNDLLNKNCTSIKQLVKKYAANLENKVFSISYQSQPTVEFEKIIATD